MESLQTHPPKAMAVPSTPVADDPCSWPSSPSTQSIMSIDSLVNNSSNADNSIISPSKIRGRPRPRSLSPSNSQSRKHRRQSELDSPSKSKRDPTHRTVPDLHAQAHLDSGVESLKLKMDEYTQSRISVGSEISVLRDVLGMMNSRLSRLEHNAECHHLAEYPMNSLNQVQLLGTSPQVASSSSRQNSVASVSPQFPSARQQSFNMTSTPVLTQASEIRHGVPAQFPQASAQSSRVTLRMNTPFWPSEVPSFLGPRVRHMSSPPYNSVEYVAKVKTIWPQAMGYLDLSDHASRTGANFERALDTDMALITVLDDQDLWLKVNELQALCYSNMVPYRFWAQFASVFFDGDFANIKSWISAGNPTWLELIMCIFKTVGPEQHALCSVAVLDQFERQISSYDQPIDVVRKLKLAMEMAPSIWSTPAATLLKGKLILKRFMPKLHLDMAIWERNILTRPPHDFRTRPVSLIELWSEQILRQVTHDGGYEVLHGAKGLPVRTLDVSSSTGFPPAGLRKPEHSVISTPE